MQFGFRAELLFERFDEFIRIERKQEVCHIFQTDIIRAHIFELFTELYEILFRIYGAGRIANRRFADSAVFLNRLHGGFKISGIVQCIDTPKDFAL